MTITELEAFLKREKTIAERELGYDMCQKYARCLFCAPTEKYPCANAHNRYEIALRHKALRAPSWLLPEPRLSDDEEESVPVAKIRPAAKPEREVREAREARSTPSTQNVQNVPNAPNGGEEEVVTVSDILSEKNPELKIPYLSELDLSVLDDEPSRRAARGVVARAVPAPDAQRVLTLRRKH